MQRKQHVTVTATDNALKMALSRGNLRVFEQLLTHNSLSKFRGTVLVCCPITNHVRALTLSLIETTVNSTTTTAQVLSVWVRESVCTGGIRL